MYNKAFFVSLVFEKLTQAKYETALRTIMLYAVNTDEAFGAAHRILSGEFDKSEGWRLTLQSVMDATDFMSNREQKAHECDARKE